MGDAFTVVLALAVDRALPPAEAGTPLAAFLVGGAWAVLLSVGIWRIHPERAGDAAPSPPAGAATAGAGVR